MPLTPTPTDPEQSNADPAAETGASLSRTGHADPDAPLSFVPHEASGAVDNHPAVIRAAGRFGALEQHELLHLLDSIEDERARGRFRESIYISLFVWLAIAWVVLYGPRYLWHAPKLVLPSDVLRQREVTLLTAPTLPRMAAPGPRAAPKLDNHTLQQLREEAARHAPPAPSQRPKLQAPTPAPSPLAPTPSNAVPNIPLPSAPRPVTARTPPPVVADAPTPQPSSRPNFSTGSTSASDSIQNAIRDSAKGRGSGEAAGGGSASPLNTGVDILSDTQGVNFDPYIRRILHDIYFTWLPLIPEEARPPLNKAGVTQIRFTILPDGHIGGMWLDGSTHDDALNRAAWGSITGVGQFPPLPTQFHGPNLELRIHYLVNKHEE